MKSSNTRHEQSGFILVLTLILLSMIAVLVTQLFQNSTIHFYFNRTMIAREKAKLLAHGGLQLAISLLTIPKSEEKKAEEKTTSANKESDEKKDPHLELLKKIAPILNRWQIITLKEDIDGLDGEIKLCITCEDGKIDINQWYDFSKKKFIGEGSTNLDGRKIFKTIFGSIKKVAGGKELFELFEKFLKQRQYKLNEVTELLSVKEIKEVFKEAIFYEPPTQETKKEQRPVYLMDIFTIWSGKQMLNPWLLSDSICAIVGLKRAEVGDTATHAKEVDQLLKGIKSVQGDVKTIWEKVLQKIYGKELKALPNDFSALLAQNFEAKTFGILSYGKIGNITQKIFAILERQKDNADVPYIIKRLYWL